MFFIFDNNVRNHLLVLLFYISWGGYYSDDFGYVSISCKKCPNGSFVAFDKAPGKQSQDCKTCPSGKLTVEIIITGAHQMDHLMGSWLLLLLFLWKCIICSNFRFRKYPASQLVQVVGLGEGRGVEGTQFVRILCWPFEFLGSLSTSLKL